MIRYSFFGYALASAIILIVCLLAYQMFFYQKIRPRLSRIVVLSILFFGMITPLVALFFISGTAPKIENISIGNPVIAKVIIEENSSPTLSSFLVPYLPILQYIYLAGIIVMIILTGVSFIRLLLIKKSAEKSNLFGITVYRHNHQLLSSFSWGNCIFLYNTIKNEDLLPLLKHELAHVRLYHWVDIMFMQCFLIFQWFNPAIWFFKKELQELHEYEADNMVIHSGTDKFDYQYLLLRNISKGRLPGLVAGIKGRSIKKRFLMMQKTDFKTNYLMRVVTISLAVFCGFVLIQMPVVAEVVETKEKVLTENIFLLNKDKTEQVIYQIDNKNVPYSEVKNIDSANIEWVEIFKGDQKFISVVTKNYNEKNPIRIRKTSDKDKAFSKKDALLSSNGGEDKAPAYIGGQDQLKMELINNISYLNGSFRIPKQGTVEVAFTVTSNGELEKFHIVKSIDSEFDIVAVKALKNLQYKWIPGSVGGKAVDMEIIVPVTFSE